MRNTLLAAAVVTVFLGGSLTVFGDEDKPAVKSAGDFVPFVIPDALAKDSPIPWPAARPIAPDSSRVRVRDGYFVLREGGKTERFRVWGVNTCFGANVPTHEEAEKTAARMASLGINSVRIHHLDTANYPDGIWNKDKPEEFHPEALDRLDYYIDQLAKNGIRVNLNLHVGRAHGRFLKLPDVPGNNYGKMVDIFTPQLVDAQKTYANNLLTRKNKYRKVRYADDAAIAFVEINNEDSLFMWGWREGLRNLPPFYADILRGQYVTWLKIRYGDTDELRAAWDKGSSPLGETMVPAVAEPVAKNDPGVWYLEQHEKCRATIKATQDGVGVRIEPTAVNATVWHLQFNTRGLKFEDGKYYTLMFRIRSDKPRNVEFGVGQAHPPWNNLGLSAKVAATEQWQEVRRGFIAPAEEDGRLSFCFSAEQTPFELADVRLCPGGEEGLDKDETLEAGNVVVFPVSSSPPRLADTMLFLVETEKAYWDGMYAYIKKDLKCGALVTGTSVFGPGNLYAQSDMDYLDGHAYWEHPQFPRKQWDWSDWAIRQRAMVDNPELSILSRLTAERLEGKPFTVSEYNHPAPQDTQAECVPMMVAFAVAQDWDGVWFFAYSHRSGALQDRFASFFDIDANPAKLGFMPAGAALLRRPVVMPLSTRIGNSLLDWDDLEESDGDPVEVVESDDDEPVDWWDDDESFPPPGPAAAKWQTTCDSMQSVLSAQKQLGDDTLGGLNLQWSVTFGGPFLSDMDYSSSVDKAALEWQVVQGKGRFKLDTLGHRDGTYVLVGCPEPPAAKPDQREDQRTVHLLSPKFAAIMMTPLDDKPLEESRKILVTACGRCENVDMGFNANRTSVSTNWGKGPVHIEAVTAQIDLPPDGKWTCHALKSDGSVGEEVSVDQEKNTLEISPKYKTMWYVLTR